MPANRQRVQGPPPSPEERTQIEEMQLQEKALKDAARNVSAYGTVAALLAACGALAWVAGAVACILFFLLLGVFCGGTGP